MAIDKKTLKMFLDNPAMYSAEDLDQEDQVESEIMPEVEPEEMIGESEEPELVAEEDVEMEDEPTAMEEGIDQKVVSDMQASPEMRKKALQRIKQKYLGQ